MTPKMYCDRCRAFFEAQSDCPSCEDEPLLDLGEPGILELLIEEDERDRRKHKAKWTTIAVPFVIPVFFWISMLGLGMIFSAILCVMIATILGQILGETFKFKPRPLPRGDIS